MKACLVSQLGKTYETYENHLVHKLKHLTHKCLFQVLAGCISGSAKLVSEIRNLHHVLGGTLNPVSFLITWASGLYVFYECLYILALATCINDVIKFWGFFKFMYLLLKFGRSVLALNYVCTGVFSTRHLHDFLHKV